MTKQYSAVHDSYYDDKTLQWLEEGCGDVNCNFCSRRPEKPNPIFVFGSNLAGIHGAGAAKYAVEHHGAQYGIGIGPQGRSYGIPTKDMNIKTLPLHMIEPHVNTFLKYANDNRDMMFNVTAIGCGLAGYKPTDIAPMFKGFSSNVELPEEFYNVIYPDITT